ncbi:MAG: hypothetical protein IPJ17_06585 [Holophagales bacterium]|nr:MAG: hypothetical protein IPJ17_06585 [Holophagales bacterium]
MRPPLAALGATLRLDEVSRPPAPEVGPRFPIFNTENRGRAISLFSDLFLHATLPHSRPPSASYLRQAANLTLELTASATTGLPFGRYPRLLIAWLTTIAAQSSSRTVSFHGSFGSFLGMLGVAEGTRTREALRHQIQALFTTTYRVLLRSTAATRRDGYDWTVGTTFTLADEHALWWHPGNASGGFQALLSEPFHRHLLERRIPLDWNVLRRLQSPLAIDIYTALCNWSGPDRRSDLAIPWAGDPDGADLVTRFGADYASHDEFRRNFRLALRKVLTFYPTARVVANDPKVFIVRPYPPHVAYLNRRLVVVPQELGPSPGSEP